jgi:hypothetical protein
LRCITSEKGLELLKEIHSGFCGAHIGTRALAGKAIKQGFYWSTINICSGTSKRLSMGEKVGTMQIRVLGEIKNE